MEQTEKITAISIRGSRAYVDAVNRFSKKSLGKRTGDVIRELVDKAYGAELERYISFFEEDDQNNGQVDTKVVSHE